MNRITCSSSCSMKRALQSAPNHSKRWIHQSLPRSAITNLEMPAMSPTMTEGGIAEWKKKEGESFITGDVLLEIETDKATIDVEAQEDGIVGKILLNDGAKNIPVGKVIALLAEKGDDISNLKAPEEKSPPPKQEASSPTPPPPAPKPKPSSSSVPAPSHSSAHPKHSRPLFPSVYRLIQEFNIAKPEEIKGTGVRGMLTKGDVLAYLGLASGPTGTFKEVTETKEIKKAEKKVEVPQPLSAADIRRLIVSTMVQNSVRARTPAPCPQAVAPDFDSVIADYLSSKPSSSLPKVATQATPKTKGSTADYFAGLF